MGAEFNVIVKVDASSAPGAADTTNRALDSVQRKAKETKDVLGGMFEIFAIVEMAKELAKLSDVYSGVHNRMALVATSQENLNAIMDRTFEIAQNTRQKWDAVASTYQRLQMASQNLGFSQKGMLDFTELLGEAMQISGVKTKASSMAMMELTDAFTVGAMSGRKFRTFMQDAGAVIPLLAKGLHMTTGEFVELGLHGQATAKMFRDGFLASADDIHSAFGKMTPTIAQSLVMLENAAAHFFGTMSTSSGILGGVAQIIQFVAKHFDTFGRVLLVVGEILGVVFAVKMIGAAIDGLTALRAAAIANPWMELLLVFTGIVAILQQFGDKMDAGQKSSDGLHSSGLKVSAVMHVLWQDVKALASAVGDFVAGAWHLLTDAFSDGVDATGIEFSFKNVLLFLASFVDSGIALFHMFRDEAGPIFKSLGVLIADAFLRAFNTAIEGVEMALNAGRHAIFNLMNDTAGKQLAATNAAGDAIKQYENSPAFKQQLANIDRDHPMQMTGVTEIHRPDESALESEQAHRDYLKAQRDANADYQTAVNEHNAAVDNLLNQVSKKEHEYQNYVQGLDAQGNDTRMGSYKFGRLTNPFEESGDVDKAKGVIGTVLNAALDEATKGPAKQYVEDLFKRAGMLPPDKKGSIGTDDAAYDPYNVTPKGKDPLAGLKRQLAQVLAHDSPIDQANAQIMHAIDILDQGMQHNLVTAELASKTVAEYVLRLHDQLEPAAAMTKLLEDQNKALEENVHQREQSNKLEEIHRSLTAKGVKEDEWNGTKASVMFDDTGMMYVVEATKGLDEVYTEILDKREALEKMNDVERKHEEQITELVKKRASMYDKDFEHNRKLLEMMDPTQLTDKTLKSLQTHIADIGSSMKTLIEGIYDGLNDMLLQFINNQTVDWGKFIQKTLDDMAKLAIKTLEVTALQGVGLLPSATATVAQAAAPVTAASVGLYGPQLSAGVDGGIAGAGAGAALEITTAGADVAAAMNAVAIMLSGVSLGGLASAGASAGAAAGIGASVDTITSARTGGAGPRPTTPGQVQTGGRSAMHVHVHDDPKALLTAVHGVEGDRLVFEAYRRNPTFMKKLLSR